MGRLGMSTSTRLAEEDKNRENHVGSLKCSLAHSFTAPMAPYVNKVSLSESVSNHHGVNRCSRGYSSHRAL